MQTFRLQHEIRAGLSLIFGDGSAARATFHAANGIGLSCVAARARNSILIFALRTSFQRVGQLCIFIATRRVLARARRWVIFFLNEMFLSFFCTHFGPRDLTIILWSDNCIVLAGAWISILSLVMLVSHCHVRFCLPLLGSGVLARARVGRIPLQRREVVWSLCGSELGHTRFLMSGGRLVITWAYRPLYRRFLFSRESGCTFSHRGNCWVVCSRSGKVNWILCSLLKIGDTFCIACSALPALKLIWIALWVTVRSSLHSILN
jgi:hypothetical protein